MTLGMAIEEQRKFAADRAKLQTERDAALKSMREAVAGHPRLEGEDCNQAGRL